MNLPEADFIPTCKKIATLRLVQASSGNMSQRSFLDPNIFFVTASGCWLENITEDQIVECGFKGSLKGLYKPSTEFLMHRNIFEKRKDVNIILHYQPVYGTIISCSKSIRNFNIIPEIPYYIGSVSYVSYHKPGSKRLADAVSNALINNDLVIMRNHGLTVVGPNFEKVLQRAIFFELACEMLVKSTEPLIRIKL